LLQLAGFLGAGVHGLSGAVAWYMKDHVSWARQLGTSAGHVGWARRLGAAGVEQLVLAGDAAPSRRDAIVGRGWIVALLHERPPSVPPDRGMCTLRLASSMPRAARRHLGDKQVPHDVIAVEGARWGCTRTQTSRRRRSTHDDTAVAAGRTRAGRRRRCRCGKCR